MSNSNGIYRENTRFTGAYQTQEYMESLRRRCTEGVIELCADPNYKAPEYTAPSDKEDGPKIGKITYFHPGGKPCRS